MAKGKSPDEIIRIAAEAGAAAGIKAYEEQKQKARNQFIDTRLRNTKLLLRNYRMFKAHCESAVYDMEQLDETPYDILELISNGMGGDHFVESIKASVARTATIVKHIETMFMLYEAYCFNSGRPEEERRCRIVQRLYINEEQETVPQIAQDENIDTRTVYKDIDAACEKIAALVFGIDGIKKV